MPEPEPSTLYSRECDTPRCYFLITPARNEEDFIEQTIKSVVAQTIHPVRWVIVSDGSTDRTDEIVKQYAKQHAWIELVRTPERAERDFAGKVRAFNAGLVRATSLSFEVIGNLDADISIESDYFAKIMEEFRNDSALGVAGGMVHSNIEGRYISQNVALDSVAGAVQMFRLQCFEDIGGYLALPMGGIDAAAEITARFHGWRTATFPNLRALEHRRTGWANGQPFTARIREGKKIHALGYDPFFYALRCMYRITERPFLVGGAAAFMGYFFCMLRGEKPILSSTIVRFLRKEQRSKIWRMRRTADSPRLRI